eukprot:CAMPEP_0176499862 /NCGR_PEP_ID=MMETSP0200_2-20121128/13187_1 /TAXON_ID=947934 /ORGANISM="Chaetoceros sp., Strain GSL56" /LENGTH=1065 /DNA_ID=CAMNT_0017898377 /DNA_START=246 /DNA_END=3440 /DNA_ORIENTATION=+
MSSGDIWSTGAFAFESPLKDLLDSLDYTLEDLLREDELLQELRGLHPQLVDFFKSAENVAGLVRCLIAQPPPIEKYTAQELRAPSPVDPVKECQGTNGKLNTQQEEGEGNDHTNCSSTYNHEVHSMQVDEESDDIASPGKWLLENTTELVDANSTSTTTATSQTVEEYEKKYIRFPYMACEVICCEVPVILDVLVEGSVPRQVADDISSVLHSEESDQQSILDLLFSMLLETPPSQLDDRRAGYLEKILTMLFRKKRPELSSYINGDHLKMNDGVKKSLHRGGGKQLLEALFNHLHSNSIAQIVQRLLMPNPPSSESFDEGTDSVEKDDTENFHANGKMDEDEDDILSSDIDDFIGINSDWADSEVGLELLLNHLIVDSTVYSDKHPFTKEDEAKLNSSQHACEILITIIQHSPLNSTVMKIMTGDSVLDRLIQCACGTSSGDRPKTFSMHDSTMTTAMNVLEILILQLGGYGTVPTGCHHNDVNGSKQMTTCDSVNLESNPSHNYSIDKNESTKEAQADCLIRKLPEFLSHLCDLLTHPNTVTWKSQFQYSIEPQFMLGASRLRIVRLIESLVLLSKREVDLILCSSDILRVCLDLFWAFPWCSMLHQSVANLLVHVLEGGGDRVDLQLYFLNRCNLPKRLMDSFCEDGENNVKVTPFMNGDSSITETSGYCYKNHGIDVGQSLNFEPETKLDSNIPMRNTQTQCMFRMGYMGHIIIICQALVHACGVIDQSTETKEEGSKIKSIDQHDDSELCKVDEWSDVALRPTSMNMIMSFLRANHCYSEWVEFVATTLASETAIQTTPLGGCYSQDNTNSSAQINMQESSDSYQFDDNNDSMGNNKYVVSSGDIDLDDTDLDIAASMMESMNLSSSDNMLGSDENPGVSHGHRRQRGVIGGQGVGNASAFGTVVDLHKQPSDYIYDDPLGARQHFDDHQMENDSSDEEGDGDETCDVPVMDLFAGNFNFESNIKIEESDDTEGWANFDDAFGDAPTNYTSIITSAEPDDTSLFDASSDPFSASDVFGIVANSANIISSLSSLASTNIERNDIETDLQTAESATESELVI